MKEFVCQNIWVRWLGIIPFYGVLIMLHGKFLNWETVPGILLMLCGIILFLFITSYMTYYHVHATYIENDVEVTISLQGEKYSLMGVKEVSCLPKNLFGEKYVLMNIISDDYKLNIYSLTNTENDVRFVYKRIVMLNDNLKQEKDIWGNLIDVWSCKDEKD